MPIVSNRHLKGCYKLFSQSPGRVKMAGDFVKFDLHTREVFVIEKCLAREMKLLTQLSQSRLDSARFSDAVREVPAVQNILVRVLTS